MPKNKKNNRRTVKITPSHILIIILIVLVLITTAVSVRTLAIEEENKSEEETSNVTYVTTSDNYTIPVPNGYTASQIEGETLGKNGFVIYEGEIDWTEILSETSEEGSVSETENTNEINTNILDLQATVNQYVWVPVSDVSQLFGIDSTEKWYGKLYTYESGERIALNWTEENGLLSIENSKLNQEPGLSLSLANYDIDSKLESYLDGITRYEFLTKELEQNFYNVIQSIKKYGGFYIGRYETGGLSATSELQENGEYSTTTVVQKMNTDTTNVSWYDMYERCKTLSGTNSAVESSMIWGSLWDETIQWFLDTSSEKTTITSKLVESDSTDFGNYLDSEFEYYENSEEWKEVTKYARS